MRLSITGLDGYQIKSKDTIEHSLEKEKDPSGLSQNIPGAKLDYGKPDMDLVFGAFSRALIEVAKVGTFGAKKYSPNGWLIVPNGIKRYTSAELRHYFKEEIEGLYDEDSGLLHKAHKAWNALATLELELRKLGNEREKSELGSSKE